MGTSVPDNLGAVTDTFTTTKSTYKSVTKKIANTGANKLIGALKNLVVQEKLITSLVSEYPECFEFYGMQ